MNKLFFFFPIVFLFIAGCSPNNIHNLSPIQFNELLNNEDVFLIDVHTPEQEHISGTDLFMPYNEIQKNLDQLPSDKNSKIAVYCRSGSMSKESTESLKQLGYKNLYNLQGGRNAYLKEGFN